MNIVILIFSVFYIFSGAYIVLLFSGIIKPNQQNTNFDTIKNKYGRWFIIGGVFIVLGGVFGLLK